MARAKYLSIYLNDHLAAFTALRDVARRARRSNEGTPLGDYLAHVERELDESRLKLESLMRRLGIRRDRFKTAAARAAEKAGRLKLNGHLVRYSPLSRVLELEGLIAGAEIEARTWQALAPFVDEDVSERVAACERRKEELGRHHSEAAATALRP